MKLSLFAFFTLGISHLALAQGTFTGAKEQHIIAKKHIKQITCYWFKNVATPNDSVLVDSMLFYKTGLLLKQYNNSYAYNYEYDTKARLIKETMRTSDNSDSKVTMFNYDNKENMILSETVKKWEHTQSLYPDFVLHYFEYGSKNQVLHEYWKDLKGKVIERQRYKYIITGLEKGLVKIVEFYDENDRLTFIKKYYKDGLVKDYSIDNGKTTHVAESILNQNHDLVKFTNFYHLDENDMKQAVRDGHGMVNRDTLTEIYKYNRLGFCSEKLTYKHNKLAEILKWYFKQ